MIALVIAAGVLGGLVGSFLNVVVYRVPRGESVVSPASRCPSCSAPVSPRDNIPVVSWLVLRGRCRHCQAKISLRYPLLELLTALCFAAVALVIGYEAELAVALPFVAVLIAVAAIDFEHRVIPNKILLPAAVWGVAGSALVRTSELAELLAAGAAAFVALLLVALARPGGMGMGDVKLAGVMGLYLGLSILPAMLVAFLGGTLVGLGIMAREGAEARKRGVPFGPFLALGGLVGILAGAELIELYRDAFLS